MATDVSSRYSRRNEGEYRKVAEYIREVVRSKNGNYMVFFPSYQYMEQVEYALEDMDFPADLLVQGQGMKEQERQEYIVAHRQWKAKQQPLAV